MTTDPLELLSRTSGVNATQTGPAPKPFAGAGQLGVGRWRSSAARSARRPGSRKYSPRLHYLLARAGVESEGAERPFHWSGALDAVAGRTLWAIAASSVPICLIVDASPA